MTSELALMSATVLAGLPKKRLSVRFISKLRKIMIELNIYVESIQERRTEVIMELALLDDNGNPIMEEKDGNSVYTFAEGQMDLADKALRELMSEEQDIDIIPIKVSELPDDFKVDLEEYDILMNAGIFVE